MDVMGLTCLHSPVPGIHDHADSKSPGTFSSIQLAATRQTEVEVHITLKLETNGSISVQMECDVRHRNKDDEPVIFRS
ncbi:MAG: hypothetical protein WB424_16205 [Terracidiphilus sp.]